MVAMHELAITTNELNYKARKPRYFPERVFTLYSFILNLTGLLGERSLVDGDERRRRRRCRRRRRWRRRRRSRCVTRWS